MSRSYKEWTKAEESDLATLARDGFCSQEIAARLGRTRSSVYNRAQALGIYIQYPAGGHNGSGPSLPNEVINAIRALDDSGIDVTTIVQLLRRQFRVSSSYVRGVCRGDYRARQADRKIWQ